MANSRKSNLIRASALGFAAFLIAIVVVADLGMGPQFWPFLDKIQYSDKFGHVILFGTFSFLCNLAFPNFRLRFLPRFVTAATFVLLILISLEEISQAFIPSRTCDIIDWLADLLGLAIGQTASVLIRRKQIRSNV